MHYHTHPFLLLSDLGKLITVYRLSWCKLKTNNAFEQEKITFYRVFNAFNRFKYP